jgi:hypothetical protein
MMPSDYLMNGYYFNQSEPVEEVEEEIIIDEDED